MNMEKAKTQFGELLSIINRLRAPNGCPWDRKQTHVSLIPYMLEEANEVVAAIEDDQMDELADELGDVLLQVVLHAEIADERKQRGEQSGFNISDVLLNISKKLRHRHPHVFGDCKVHSAMEVVQNWKQLKSREKPIASEASILDSVSGALPQLTVAQKYQERAALTGFDWDNLQDVMHKLREEMDELLVEVNARESQSRIENELGDLIFAMVNLARFLNVNAEEALRKANRKFRRRFTQIESMLGGSDKMKEKSLEELDLLWDEVKKAEYDAGDH